MKSEYDFSKGKRGPVIKDSGKTRITIYLDKEVVNEFRRRADEQGTGYQPMINKALREYLDTTHRPIDEDDLRRILREELTTTRG